MSHHQIPRRTFLRGVGTTMALPFLESLVPRSLRAATATAAPPVRMAWVYIPQGAYMPDCPIGCRRRRRPPPTTS
jgi:hypothetical protein